MRLESGSRKVNILGSPWTVAIGSAEEYPMLSEIAGYTDPSLHTIVVCDMQGIEPGLRGDLDAYRDRIVRHEVIHAFLCESGIDGNGLSAENWEQNEEMVDWFAIQFPKIADVFMELGVL